MEELVACILVMTLADRFQRAVTDPEIIGNDLVGLSGDESIKDLALTVRKSSHPV
jgi:hypothetical protein